MKKVTKKEIARVLRSKNATDIFRLAKQFGVDVNNRTDVYNFIRQNAPSNRVYRAAYDIAYCAGQFRKFRNSSVPGINMPIKRAVDFAKQQKMKGFSPYSKVLIVGHTNIYWASPVSGHSDYNKSVAFPKSEGNLIAAYLINRFLNYDNEA